MIKAVTAIWAIRDRLDNAIKYVEDDDKTIEKTFDYISNDEKTDGKKYATYLNCDAFQPQKSMSTTKKMFDDTKPIVAYHGYQSFKVGEVTADIAHEIGVRLAQELYADRFEVIVTTHLDKKHIHNHILLNSTSFVDGKRFCNTKKDYRKMQETSDKLCLEYGLSVIKNPQYKSKKVNYHVLNSYMKDIKKDMDILVQQSNFVDVFWDNMKKKGYALERIGEEYAIYHPYYSEPIFLKTLGEQYHYENIEDKLTDKRILPQETEHTKSYYQCKEYYKKYKKKQLTGPAGIRVAYLISLNVLPTRKQKLSKEARQALRKLDMFVKEIELLYHNKIEDINQLDDYQQVKQNELDKMIHERQRCYYHRMKATSEEEKEEWSAKAKQFTPAIKKLRMEVKACDNIRNRSFKDDVERIAWKKIRKREQSR